MKEVRSADPANPVVYLHLGELAINGNNFDEAGSMLRQANRCMNMGWRSSSNPCSQSFVVNEEKTEQCRSLIHSSIYALLGVSMLRTNPHKPEVRTNFIGRLFLSITLNCYSVRAAFVGRGSATIP